MLLSTCVVIVGLTIVEGCVISVVTSIGRFVSCITGLVIAAVATADA